jgi:type IV secretory pathway TrbD component
VSAAKKPGRSKRAASNSSSTTRSAPTRKDKTRPVELIGLSAVFGVFTGLIVGLATREWILAAIFFGVVFIVSLVSLAMIMLGQTPDADLPKVDDETPTH